MSVDIQEEKKRSKAGAAPPPEDTPPPRPPLSERLRSSFAQIDWRTTLLTALVMALGWCLLFLAPNILQILAGVVPVLGGLFLGRRVKQQLLLHGIILGLAGFLFGLVAVLVYGGLSSAGIVPALSLTLEPNQPPVAVTADQLIFFYVSYSLFAMIPFPIFGTVMAGRSEQRNREMRQYVEDRGGRLERPGTVRTLEDLQGLSLPQLGTYVNNLFKKNGFEFIDYRFIDKDKHLDLDMKYNDELYLLRLSVADKVRPGTIESLVQEMKRRDIPKGLALTSTEFTPDAQKSAKGRRSIVTIDGPTLFEIAEN